MNYECTFDFFGVRIQKTDKSSELEQRPMTSNPTMLSLMRHQKTITLVALCAIWLQILAFGLHSTASARAAAGVPLQSEFAGFICTANGLAAVAIKDSEAPVNLEKDCTICALTAFGDFGIHDNVLPFVRTSHKVATVFWPLSSSDSTLPLSPRVGASRAPPLL